MHVQSAQASELLKSFHSTSAWFRSGALTGHLQNADFLSLTPAVVVVFSRGAHIHYSTYAVNV